MFNPLPQVTKKHLFDLIPEKYQDHEKIIERVAAYLVVPSDIQEFLNLANAIYITGYEKAIDSYREELSKLGYHVNISFQRNDGV